MTAAPGSTPRVATDGVYGTDPAATSSRTGMTPGKVALTHSTMPACERKFAERLIASSARSPMPAARARRKSPTSASRKR